MSDDTQKRVEITLGGLRHNLSYLAAAWGERYKAYNCYVPTKIPHHCAGELGIVGEHHKTGAWLFWYGTGSDRSTGASHTYWDAGLATALVYSGAFQDLRTCLEALGADRPYGPGAIDRAATVIRQLEVEAS